MKTQIWMVALLVLATGCGRESIQERAKRASNKAGQVVGESATSEAVAVPPAEEGELSFPDECPSVMVWMNLPKGIDWGIKNPGSEIQGQSVVTRAFRRGDPLIIEVYLRNRLGVTREMPLDLYHGPTDGGPSFRQGIRLFLRWAPFNPKTPDAEYPREQDYVDVKPKRNEHFAPGRLGKMMEKGETCKAFEFDLRDWFDVGSEGHYRFFFEFDEKEMGMPKDEYRGCMHTEVGFDVGTRPRRLTMVELNKDIEPLGGSQNETRLNVLIHETISNCAPSNPPADAASLGGLFEWSKPVNGLVGRIEQFAHGGYGGRIVFVRLKNVGSEMLLVPMGNPTNTGVARQFELYAKYGDAPWKQATWFPGERFNGAGARVDDGDSGSEGTTGNNADRPPVILKPGEDTLAYLCGSETEESSGISEIKVILRQPESRGNKGWHGVLSTPPYPGHLSEKDLKRYSHSLPLPTHLPAFSRVRFMGGNMSGNESEVTCLGISNRELFGVLELYEVHALRTAFEQWMQNEKDPAMKLLLAPEAAVLGSEKAALYLLNSMKNTDYEVVRNTHAALTRLFWHYEQDPPDWIVQLVIAALSDDRHVTGLEKTNWSSGTHFTISYLADEHERLPDQLGWRKCTNAVPFLIEMTKKTRGRRGPVMALGILGDERAIPVLIECLRLAGTTEEESEGNRLSEGPRRCIEALANLRAKEAVPVVLEYIEYPEAIEALDRIGDPRAIEALKGLVNSGGSISKNGRDGDRRLDPERLVAAKIALASLDPKDRTERLCRLLNDASFDEFQRRSVVWRLGDRPTPEAVPHLVKAVKTDPSGVVVNQAIAVLSVFKYKTVVEELIECFDASFDRKSDWKRAYTPQMFRDSIAESLRCITGQKFGTDKKQWATWWQQNKDAFRVIELQEKEATNQTPVSR